MVRILNNEHCVMHEATWFRTVEGSVHTTLAGWFLLTTKRFTENQRMTLQWDNEQGVQQEIT